MLGLTIILMMYTSQGSVIRMVPHSARALSCPSVPNPTKTTTMSIDNA